MSALGIWRNIRRSHPAGETAQVLLALILVGSLLGCRSPRDKETRVEKVTDGDTFSVIWEGREEKVRLIGIDTPESRRNAKAYKDAKRSQHDVDVLVQAGKRATAFVKTLLRPGDQVRLEFDVQERDQYGRLLAYVYLPDGRMLNEVLLREGYASLLTVPPNVKYVERFHAAYREGQGGE